MNLIVGLGNPGRKYELTRHNVGFEIIDLLRGEIRAGKAKRQDFSLVVKGRLEGEDLILAKPQTSMNLSGMAVALLMSRYGVSLDDLCVIYDDLNLANQRARERDDGCHDDRYPRSATFGIQSGQGCWQHPLDCHPVHRSRVGDEPR